MPDPTEVMGEVSQIGRPVPLAKNTVVHFDFFYSICGSILNLAGQYRPTIQ
jgi:hypothetical protein